MVQIGREMPEPKQIVISFYPETKERLSAMMVERNIKSLTPYVMRLLMEDLEKWESSRGEHHE